MNTDNLARVLYDALKDEDPRIASLLGPDIDALRPVLSTLLAEAAAQQWVRQKVEARVAQLAQTTPTALRDAADRFERECPDAGGPMDLCMCHAAAQLRDWADEREAANKYAQAISAPPSPEVCATIRKRIEDGTAPRRRVRRRPAATEEPTS